MPKISVINITHTHTHMISVEPADLCQVLQHSVHGPRHDLHSVVKMCSYIRDSPLNCISLTTDSLLTVETCRIKYNVK